MMTVGSCKLPSVFTRSTLKAIPLVCICDFAGDDSRQVLQCAT
jgi:hypothetical protein